MSKGGRKKEKDLRKQARERSGSKHFFLLAYPSANSTSSEGDHLLPISDLTSAEPVSTAVLGEQNLNAGQDWVKLVEECSLPSVPAYVKLILNLLLDTKEQMDAMRKWCAAFMEENDKLKAENEKLKKIIEEKDSQIRSNLSKAPVSDPALSVSESDVEKK
ncbi:hypothetical protein OSTOST_09340, partial [Ostertagia ostertagi]